jgi:predicted SAM-dependent methyltransferase
VKLNLGCGDKAEPGWLNVDIAPLYGVDQIVDLDAPWPWPDGAAEKIQARHLFEHLWEPVLFMCEAWRVLEPGGELQIVSPYWRHVSAFTDPTHKRFCTEWTWDYWVKGTPYFEGHNAAFGGVAFTKVRSAVLGGMELDVTLRKETR